MKFAGNLIINKSQNTVAECFVNPKYNKEYQDGFEKKELISGVAGQDGAVSKLYYKYGKRKLELTETITSNKLPHSFKAFYHHKHMDNTMLCNFVFLDDTSTRFEYELEYTRFSGLLPNLMAIFAPSMFRKQTEKWMIQFKEFVEKFNNND